jgi:hypothetical protein
MPRLPNLKSLFERLKSKISFPQPKGVIKGVIIDFAEKESLELGLVYGYSDYMPLGIFMDLLLFARNEDLKPHLFQEFNMSVQGLEKTTWTNSFAGIKGHKPPYSSLQVPMDLLPGQHLPFRLRLLIEFGHRDASRFVDEFNKLKNARLGVKILYTAIEGTETKTRELVKGNINFYALFYPGYESYLAGIRDDVKASKLLDDLRHPTHHKE